MCTNTGWYVSRVFGVCMHTDLSELYQTWALDSEMGVLDAPTCTRLASVLRLGRDNHLTWANVTSPTDKTKR